MTADEYVPNDDDERIAHAYAEMIHLGSEGMVSHDDAVEEFYAYLAAHDARVRHDAARNALIKFRQTELDTISSAADEDDPIRIRQQALAWRIEMHLLVEYPEETP